MPRGHKNAVANGEIGIPIARAALHHMAHVWLRLAQDAENRARSQEDEVSEFG
jgi:hypothetical protein